MATFEISVGGKNFEVDAPDQTAALSAIQRMTGPKPVAQGDWQGLGERLKKAELDATDVGPITPEMAAQARRKAAQEEGRRYGMANAEKGSGLIQEGMGRAMDKFALGVPRLAEAYMPGFLGGQSAIPGAEAHEFLKSADEGRAKENPLTAGAGNIAGIVGQTIAMPASAARTLGGRMLTSGGQAAGLGAAEGAVESRGDMGEISKGAGYGFAGGFLGQGAGEAAVRGGRALIDPLRGLAKSGPANEQAAARIALELKNAKMGGGDVAKRLADLGPEAFVGDAMGLQGATMARSAANLSPEARSILESATYARNARQPDRLIADINAATGNPAGKTRSQLVEVLQNKTRPKISEAYDSARAAGYDLPYTPFEGLLASPKVSNAVKQAITETKDRIAAFGGDQNSRLAVYDAAKKILDRQGWKDGDEVAKVLARKLRETVDEYIPEYGGARGLAAKVKRSEEGLEIGAEAAARNPGRDVADNINQAVSRGVPQGRVAQGYGTQRVDMLANKGASEVNLKLAPAEESAMRAALGPEAEKVMKGLGREREFAKFHKELTGNSSTARQLAQQMTGAGLVGGGAGWAAGFDPMTSGITAATMAAGRRGLQKAVEASRGKNERAVAEKLAEVLIGRSVPSVARSETARRALIEALMKDMGRGAGYSVGQ